MAAAKRTCDPTLADVLRELGDRGLLGRATSIVVGAVSVTLYPQAVPPPNETAEERQERIEREREEVTYGSS